MLELLFWPFVAGLLLTGIHAYFGLHVLARGIVFVDLSLAQVAALPKPPFCVGFAAETEQVRTNAIAKRRRKNIPLMVANRAQDSLGQDDSELILIDAQGSHVLPRAQKLLLARQLVAHIADLL